MAPAKLLVRDPATGAPLGIVDAFRCDSRDHAPRIATQRVHWPTGPGDFCTPCATTLIGIAGVLGTHVYAAPLPPVPVLPGRRALDLEGE